MCHRPWIGLGDRDLNVSYLAFDPDDDVEVTNALKSRYHDNEVSHPNLEPEDFEDEPEILWYTPLWLMCTNSSYGCMTWRIVGAWHPDFLNGIRGEERFRGERVKLGICSVKADGGTEVKTITLRKLRASGWQELRYDGTEFLAYDTK